MFCATTSLAREKEKGQLNWQRGPIFQEMWAT